MRRIPAPHRCMRSACRPLCGMSPIGERLRLREVFGCCPLCLVGPGGEVVEGIDSEVDRVRNTIWRSSADVLLKVWDTQRSGRIRRARTAMSSWLKGSGMARTAEPSEKRFDGSPLWEQQSHTHISVAAADWSRRSSK
jgi:hypothetical protein